MAGLFLFRSLSYGDELPPARSAAPALLPTATPEVRAADLQAMRDAVAAKAREQAELLEDQAHRLSRTAASLEEMQRELRSQVQSAKALDNSLAGVGSSLSDLDKRVAALGQAAAVKDVDASTQAAKLKGLADDLAGLHEQMTGNVKQMKDGLAEIAALRDDLKQRQSKLDSLTDLLTVMKKDVDNNSEEIVEVKQGLQRLEPKLADKPLASDDWWEQGVTWKYLPAVAVALSGVAIGIAASHK